MTKKIGISANLISDFNGARHFDPRTTRGVSETRSMVNRKGDPTLMPQRHHDPENELRRSKAA